MLVPEVLMRLSRTSDRDREGERPTGLREVRGRFLENEVTASRGTGRQRENVNLAGPLDPPWIGHLLPAAVLERPGHRRHLPDRRRAGQLDLERRTGGQRLSVTPARRRGLRRYAERL